MPFGNVPKMSPLRRPLEFHGLSPKRYGFIHPLSFITFSSCTHPSFLFLLLPILSLPTSLPFLPPSLPLSLLQSFSLPFSSFASSPFPSRTLLPPSLLLRDHTSLTFDVLRNLHLFLWPASQNRDMFCGFSWFSSCPFRIFRLCRDSFEL